MTADASGRVRRAHTRLRPAARSAAEARTFVTATLRTWAVPRDLTADIVLAVSELVTNAIEHGRGEVALELELDGRCLRLRVRDDGTGRPVRRRLDSASDRGRGVAIVDALAQSWGHRTSGAGKWVWAEFEISP